MNSALCRLGIHKWKNHGSPVLVVWKEPGLFPGTKVRKKKYVFAKRECLRCGIREERKFSETIDGEIEITGCERIQGSNE